jgi:hypothetical protein
MHRFKSRNPKYVKAVDPAEQVEKLTVTEGPQRGRFAAFKKALGLYMQTRAGKQRSRKAARLRVLHA